MGTVILGLHISSLPDVTRPFLAPPAWQALRLGECRARGRALLSASTTGSPVGCVALSRGRHGITMRILSYLIAGILLGMLRRLVTGALEWAVFLAGEASRLLGWTLGRLAGAVLRSRRGPV